MHLSEPSTLIMIKTYYLHTRLSQTSYLICFSQVTRFLIVLRTRSLTKVLSTCVESKGRCLIVKYFLVRQVTDSITAVSLHSEEIQRKYRKEMHLRKKYHNELVELKGDIIFKAEFHAKHTREKKIAINE